MRKDDKHTLIIHPYNPEMDFLQGIYRDLRNYTLIRGKVPRAKVVEAIQASDRLLFMGKGDGSGLYTAAGPDNELEYIIDETMFPWLVGKENIFIWRDAYLFGYFNHLQGFFTGKIAYNLNRALFYRIGNVTPKKVEESNLLFTSQLRRLLHLSVSEIYPAFCEAYGTHGSVNSVIDFNCKRIQYYTGSEFLKFINSLKDEDEKH
jgi:hypothetical protein